MIILAIDMANFKCSIALARHNQLLGFHQAEQFRGQDATLIPQIQTVLEKANIDFKDITHLVVSTGPGSFTGIRLSMAAIKGLALALNTPAIGIKSFEFIAKTIPNDLVATEPFLLALDAQRDDVYCQAYDQNRQPITQPISVPLTEINAHFDQEIIIGNASAQLKNTLSKQEFTLIDWMPDARDLAFLAHQIIMEKRIHDYPLTPFYLRPPDINLKK